MGPIGIWSTLSKEGFGFQLRLSDCQTADQPGQLWGPQGSDASPKPGGFGVHRVVKDYLTTWTPKVCNIMVSKGMFCWLGGLCMAWAIL